MTPLKAQSLLLNNYDSSNGNLAWTTPASNPNNGRSPKEIPLDAINPDKLGQGGKAYGAAGDNKAIYTTKITYYGNKDSAPTIKWLYSDVAGLSQFKDVGDAVTLKYSDVGKKIGNISKLNSRVAELEKSFMSSGKAFNKFSGYIKLEAMYPTESKDLNNSSYAEWNAIVSLYIDNATNPMDYGNTHFYFRCQAEAQYMQNWDSADMKPYTTAATDAYTPAIRKTICIRISASPLTALNWFWITTFPLRPMFRTKLRRSVILLRLQMAAQRTFRPCGMKFPKSTQL